MQMHLQRDLAEESNWSAKSGILYSIYTSIQFLYSGYQISPCQECKIEFQAAVQPPQDLGSVKMADAREKTRGSCIY
jgi:hypothetical protein